MPAPANPLLAAALAVAADPPPLPAGWPTRGRVWPTAKVTDYARRAGWPLTTVVIAVPQHEHRGPRAGQRTGDADQPVTCVPRPWLEAMAAAAGRRWQELCRGRIGDDA